MTKKTEALGFLHILSRDKNVRQNWERTPNWPLFFEEDEASEPVTNALNQLGGFASGNFTDPKENQRKWHIVATNVLDTFSPQFANPVPDVENQAFFDVVPDNWETLPHLAVLLALIAYNEKERTAFKADPQTYLNNIPEPDNKSLALSKDMAETLVAYAQDPNLTTEQRNDMLDEMVSQYYETQANIW